MSKPTYFVITYHDGISFVDPLSREHLVKRLGDGFYGNRVFLENIAEKYTSHWGRDILIIKGEIVVPKAVEVVKRYEV